MLTDIHFPVRQFTTGTGGRRAQRGIGWCWQGEILRAPDLACESVTLLTGLSLQAFLTSFVNLVRAFLGYIKASCKPLVHLCSVLLEYTQAFFKSVVHSFWVLLGFALAFFKFFLRLCWAPLPPFSGARILVVALLAIPVALVITSGPTYPTGRLFSGSALTRHFNSSGDIGGDDLYTVTKTKCTMILVGEEKRVRCS